MGQKKDVPRQCSRCYFLREIEAARAYDAPACKYHGEFANLNFPEEGPRGPPGG